MGYRRNRKRRYRKYGRGTYSTTVYSQLTGLLGNVVGNIRQAFFELDRDDADELFEEYGLLYGNSAESYARKTYPSWKNGRTGLSGQTMERLIELVPPYLSADQRYELLQIVLKKYKKPKPYKSIRINIKNPDEGLALFETELAAMRQDDALAYLPDGLLNAAKWLYDDDLTSARAMLAQAEKIENEIIKANAVRDIQLLKDAIYSKKVNAASYSVEMPAGRISVTAYEPSKCFVATVCFGTDSHQVRILRNWRDSVLIHSNYGRKFVVWYYNNGEPIAKFINKVPILKLFVQINLSIFLRILNLKP